MATREKVKQILLSMISLPNAPDVSVGAEELITRYHEVLSHWPDDLLEMAALHYRSTETFFPTEGVLNNKVLDLQMIAMGVPTAGEAWSQVLGAVQYVQGVSCDYAFDIRKQAVEGKFYADKINALNEHGKTCEICKPGGYYEIYGHPVVEETVKLLGGRDNLFTDNPAADRKQFIDAYRERVLLEGRKAIMPPAVKGYIASARESSKSLELMGDVAKRLGAG